MLSRFTRSFHRLPISTRSFATTLKLELKSGRIGKIELNTQDDLDKMLDRCYSVGLVEDSEDDPISVVIDVTKVDSKKTYQLAYGFDESEVFDDEEYSEGEEEPAQRS